MVEHSDEIDEIPRLKWPRRFPVPRDSGVAKTSRIIKGKSRLQPEAATRIATLGIYRHEPDNGGPAFGPLTASAIRNTVVSFCGVALHERVTQPQRIAKPLGAIGRVIDDDGDFHLLLEFFQ